MTSVLRFLLLFAMVTSIAIPALAQDSAESNESTNESTGEPEKLVASTFKEGMAKARRIGKPLVIFGLSDT